MHLLDDIEKIKELDKSLVLESAALLPDQIKQAWEEVFELKIPISEYQKVQDIVVAGMGGSALGARIIDSLSFEVLDYPLEIVNDYHLPAYADRDSLVIISSYSGNTEEVLSCCLQAIKKKCRIFVIATGGKLAQMAKKHSLPTYIFKARYNPSRQPRLGLGYSIAAQLALLSKIGFVRLGEAQMTEAVSYLEKQKERLVALSPLDQNLAKKLAAGLKGKMAVLLAAEHLTGAAHAVKNMLNENSKTFAAKFDLPELNHHLLEGLAYPKEGKKILNFLLLDSDFYDERIKTRMKVTNEVLAKNKLDSFVLDLKGRTRLIQVFETICLGGFASAYLAFLYGIDPAPIPWVDYFKKRMIKA